MTRLALVLAALQLSGCATRAWFRPSALVEGAHEIRDVAYWQGEGFDERKHRLDIYVPKGEGPFPVLVFVHGGGWFLGDRQQPGGNYVQLGRRMANQGVLTLVVSYRLAPGVRHPEQVRDVARALSWAFRHAADHGGDTSAVFAMGHSAGAHLVSLAACDGTWLKEQSASPTQLAGVVAVSGPYDVAHLGRSLFIGGPMVFPAFGPDHSVWKAASPASHLGTGRAPPFLVAWADGDAEVLRHDAVRFVEALRQANVQVSTFEATFDDHLSVISDFGDQGNALGEQVLQFMQRRRLELRREANTR